MITDIYITVRDRDEGLYLDPPGQELCVSVTGDDVHLGLVDVDEAGHRTPRPERDIIVPARSLLLALQAGINDTSATRS
ncbi:hypothetical protein ACFORH_43435 [Amycolatopsis roodepoortensis]|uniref:DUF2283 domain-containing protein n=1 Tax=Amycolatopsis roodepoortensis TaxID=700274 RepID=A0ABR9LIA9_9PSEU|nr:hypothetical protein [Amycolatopsis roodepoortensis]MBE1580404.1 hypothetical protein [Amycolatopsis roodepoortensis]